ncbi:glycoside hydrolase family 16 protein [Pleurotus eryngii]|uniref:Glycoside hydrolase family 16 protein n=1 Tax=Pleurotus eryngii TaxID=5323 RepID=A0A9P5ZYZ7_PLEER|nr:glycoside hydrolase family 16 protein [Pleurotus eryngii]
MFVVALLTLALPLSALAGRHGEHPGRRRHSHIAARNASNISRRQGGAAMKLVDMYQGQDFFNDWNFFTNADPTHGSVQFQGLEDAKAKNLAFVQDDGTTVLAVDDKTHLPVGTNRASVRIESKKTYNEGLFIADFFAMPHGCSVWPAWWSVGPNWPSAGEIDVLEGVHNSPTNHYTLHTSPGCTLSTNNPGNTFFEASIVNTECASSGDNNAGCGLRDTDARSYGEGFNRAGGGVFAHMWGSDGIKIWHFARNEIPQDIKDNKPKPSAWPTPSAFFASDTCDVNQHFHDHTLVIDTTLCGDLGNPTYSSSGCPGSCAEAVADPNNFIFAKWKINYIAVYQ